MRHVFTREERSKGGKARAQQPDFSEMCSKGFWACMEKHPFYGRHWLKFKIEAYNLAKKGA